MAALPALQRVVARAGWVTIAVVAVVAAAVVGALIAATFASGVGSGPGLPPQAMAGQPVVQAAAVGADHAKVVVVPHRPGPNLVWVDGEGYRVGTERDQLVAAERRPGAPGGWAVLDLRSGASMLWVEHAGHRASIALDAEPVVPELPGITTADGPECLSAVVGAVMAGAAPLGRCPDQALAAADRRALRGMIRSIADRHVPGIRLVGGDSPRADAAEALVRRQAHGLGLAVDGPPRRLDARVVVGDWSTAEQALIQQTRDPAGSGVYLAPWLANGTLLGYSSGAVVVLNYDTTQGPAAEYVADLDRFATRKLASPEGFAAWLAASGRPAPAGPARLYAALAGFDLMGADPGMRAMNGMNGMQRSVGGATGGWIPNGRMTSVSKPLNTS
jgi:hypothetical protein